MNESQYLNCQYGDNYDVVTKCDFCHNVKPCMATEDENIGPCHCCADCYGK